MNDYLNLVGRILIAFLFFGGALQKVIDPGPVRQMIVMLGLPGWLIWLVALFNFASAIGLIFGPAVRRWALFVAAYCIFTSWFHWQFRADPWQVTIAVKNWAIAGGLLVLAAQGPGRFAFGHATTRRNSCEQ
jgi:putative oxidoreductase